jgi:hypothetical protein
MTRRTPSEAARDAVARAWDVPPPGEPDRYPSTQGTADAVLAAIYAEGYRVVDGQQLDELRAAARHLEQEVRRLERLAART